MSAMNKKEMIDKIKKLEEKIYGNDGVTMGDKENL